MVRRFYERVSVAPIADGFAVLLDAKPVLSPGKRALILPDEPLARSIADEWAGQGERVQPASMPLTRLANTALDTVAERREAVIADVAKYAATDMVCYRVEQPAVLRRRQAAAWDPLVLWAGQTHGAEFVVTSGLLPAAQPDAALQAIGRAVEGFDAFGLAALHAATAALGSVVIALAMAASRISAEQAWHACLIEETYQAEHWGEDADARTRRANLQRDLTAAGRFLVRCP